MIARNFNFINQLSRVSKDVSFSSAMHKLTVDDVMSLGHDPIVLPKHNPNFIDFFSSPDNMHVSKYKSTSGNSSYDKNIRHLKALPNGNLKCSLSNELENNNSADDSIQFNPHLCKVM